MATIATGQTFDTISDLRGSAGQDRVQAQVLGLTSVTDDNGGMYRWDAASTANDDGMKVVQATGVATGRWMRVGNSNTIKGTTTFSATLLTTAYTVTHGLPFTPAQVYIQAKSANAAVPSWISAINPTTFTVNFASVPVLGTNNISIDWLVIKI